MLLRVAPWEKYAFGGGNLLLFRVRNSSWLNKIPPLRRDATCCRIETQMAPAMGTPELIGELVFAISAQLLHNA
eukprot:7686959-Lingulodinium_polyedra.AAC.1